VPRPPRMLVSLILAAVLALSAVLPAGAQQARTFKVVNNTPIAFAQLYVSPMTTTDWGDDWLGNQVLGPGDAWAMTFNRYVAGQCLYDVKVIGKNGEEGKLIGVDLCTVDTITFSASRPPPRALIEGWLKASPGMNDESTTTITWDTSPDGKSTVAAFRPKGATTSPVKGVNVAIGESETIPAAAAQIGQIATARAGDGWKVDAVAPESLAGRAFATGAKQGDDGMVTLFQVVQAGDLVILVSAIGSPDGIDALGQAVGLTLVDVLKAVDPTLKA
jgi:hypothetical protein